MGAWYGELPFAYPTTEFRKWWKRYSPEPQQRPFGKLAAAPWTHYEIAYPDTFPMMEPGKLWWPTGAGRFGVYYGIADHKTVEYWRDQTTGTGAGNATNIGLKFYMSDRADSGRELDYMESTMYMLPPRPLTFSFGPEPTYLVTLVDDRYFWWDVACDDLTQEPITTWEELFEYFRDKLAYDETDWKFTRPSEDYYKPGELLSRAANVPLAVLIDAAAWSIGCRVVLDFDIPGLAGGVSIQPIEEAKANRNASLGLQRLLAGGLYKMQPQYTIGNRDSAYLVPDKTLVSFPRFKYGRDTYEDKEEGRTSFEILTKDLSGFTGYQTNGLCVVHDTANAYPEGDTDEALKKLAKRITEDYLLWLTESNVDMTLAGLRYLYPCGLYDAIEWHEYIYDDTELMTEEENGYLMQEEKEATMSYTKVTKPPFMWRAFTLHHSVGGSSSSRAARPYTWILDCGAGTVTTGPVVPPVDPPCVPDPANPKKCQPTSSSVGVVPRDSDNDGIPDEEDVDTSGPNYNPTDNGTGNNPNPPGGEA